MSLLSENQRYAIAIAYNDADQGWIAEIPELRYCTAFGHSPREALEELERALAAWLMAAKAEKKTIPLPGRGKPPFKLPAPPRLRSDDHDVY